MTKPTALSRNIRLGLIQQRCEWDVKANLAKAERMIRQAAQEGAQLIVTQELFGSRYFCQKEEESYFDLAEPVPGPTTQRMSRLARELKVGLVVSVFERRAAGLYHNTAVVIDAQGQMVGRYRKMHIPDDPRYYEKYYFTPGDLGWPVHKVAGVKLGVLICWDQWYPEAARAMALAGAEILVYPTAIGWWHGEPVEVRKQQKEAWITIQRAHAIANGLFVAAINRVGTEDDLEFWGNSFVCDPGGRILAQAPGDREQVLVVECDLKQIELMRRGWPFLRDRRIDAYGAVLQRYLEP